MSYRYFNMSYLLKFLLKLFFSFIFLLYFFSFENHKIREKRVVCSTICMHVCQCVWGMKNAWGCVENLSSAFCVYIYVCVCVFFYLKFNSERFVAFGNTLTWWFMCGISLMIGFRCGEITCNTINVLSIRFKYWIKSDSDKMYSKMDRLMLLFDDDFCIAAGCSPIKCSFTSTPFHKSTADRGGVGHEKIKWRKKNTDVLSMLCVSFVYYGMCVCV